MIPRNGSAIYGSSLLGSKSWSKRPPRVPRYLQFSLASSLAACTSFCNLENGLVYVLLFCSKNLSTFFILSELSCSQMEFRLELLCSQKASSSVGSGCFPFLNALSGSCFKTFLIYLVHVIIAPKFKIKLKPAYLRTFKDMGFIFRRRLLFGRHILWGKWEHSSAIDLSDGHVDVSQEIVELVHQVLGN